MAISLVIPVFNEENSLRKLYEELQSSLKQDSRTEVFEVIFVDDGSSDNSLKLLLEIKKADSRVHVLRLRKNSGKARALREGFGQARYKTVATMDADLQDDPANISVLLDELEKGYDMVVGWKKERNDPIDKTFPSRIFNGLVRLMTKTELHDINSGLKVMKRQVAKDLLLYGELHRFIPIMAVQMGYSVGEVAVSHRAREFGVSKYGSTRFFKGFMDLFTVLFLNSYGQRPLHFFGGLGLLSLGIGVLFALYLTYLKLLGQSIGTRPLLLFSVLLIIAGIQSFSTGLIAELLVNRMEKSSEIEEED